MGEQGTYIIKEKKMTLKIDSESLTQSYTIENDTITVESGAVYKLAENYNVLYMPKYKLGEGVINTRNGYFKLVRWKPTLSGYSNFTYNFDINGGITVSMSADDAFYSFAGKYTMNNGVIIVNLEHLYTFAGNTMRDENISDSFYMYVDGDYALYVKVCLRDYKQFLKPSEDNSNGNSNGNYNDNEQNAEDRQEEFTLSYGVVYRNSSETIFDYAAGYIEGNTLQTVKYGKNGAAVKAVAESGYKFVGWSDGVSTAERTDTNVTENIKVHAIFEDDVSESPEPPQPNKPIEPDEEHQKLHQELNIGSTCPECGLEIYLRSNESVLLYNRNKEYARAEYYGESATNVFSAFSSVVREVYISKNVKFIKTDAFSGCSSLKEVYISENVKSIGNYAFWGCYALKTVVIAENSSLNSVGNNAFSYCRALKEFNIPSSATEQISIGERAFVDCEELSTISLPKNVISVGRYAFSGTAWFNAQPEGEIAYLGHIAYKFNGTVPFDSSLSIKEGTTVIAQSCFYNQGMLRRITLPESLQYIGDDAFEDCTSLLNVELQKNLVSIGIYAFSNCISITEVTIPASLCRINRTAFSGCSSLASVVFESAEGWVDTDNKVVDLIDPVANAKKLKANTDFEYDRYWYEKTKEEV